MNMMTSPGVVEFTHFHIFCGLGAAAKGMNKGHARVGSLTAKFRCIGGIDNNPAAIRDFSRLAGVPGTVMDLFDREQYLAFFGREPPPGWRVAMPEDIRRAASGERPNMVFLSAPCKGFSGLLPETSSKTPKYQALNRLTLRGVWLALEAWKDDPPELFVFENVPRIATRGRHLLDQIIALFRAYGYAVAETTHDCGELGGLAQSRKRFLLVARHEKKVPPFLYEPEKRRLLSVGEVLDKFPLPGDPAGGAMHRVPALQWKTWVRLAFVEAGSDWRSLNNLAVQDGYLRDYGIAPSSDWHSDVLGVPRWGETAGTIPGRSSPSNGRYSVADPRFEGLEYSQYGVRRWEESTGAVIAVKSPGQGYFSVADPRMNWGDGAHPSKLAVSGWDEASGTVNGSRFLSGAGAVADPRPSPRDDYKQTKYRVTHMQEAAGTVIAASSTGNGAFAVADPRPIGLNAKRDHYQTGGHYGVLPWKGTANAVPGFAKYDRGQWSVADPREQRGDPAFQLPEPDERLVAVIRALDGTWHRPFTVLELAALQSLVDPDEIFTLDGQSETAWRERIGNAVPPAAAEAIAGVMGTTLLLAMTGETFVLSSQPIWVRPIAMALAVDQRGNIPHE